MTRLLNILALAAAFTFAALMLGERLTWLLQQRYPLDYDGFYYLQQFDTDRSGISYGSPFFLVARIISRLLGLHPYETYVLFSWGSLLCFVFSVTIAAFKNQSPVMALTISALASRSDALFYLSYGYPRQFFGVALFTLALSSLWFSKGRLTRLGLVGVAFSALVHIFSAALTAIFLSTANRGTIKSLFRALGIVIIAAFVGVTAFSKGLGHELSFSSALPWTTAAQRGWITGYEYHEYLLYFAVSWLLFPLAVARRTKFQAAILAWVLILMLPLWNNDGAVWYRFLSSAPPLWFIAAPLTFRRGAENDRLLALPSAVIAALFILGSDAPFSERRLLGPAMPVSTLENHASKLKQWMGHDAFVVAPHGIQYRIQYLLSVRSSLHSPINGSAVKIFLLDQSSESDLRCIDAGELSPASNTTCVSLGEGWRIRAIT